MSARPAEWSQTTNLDDELRSYGISQAGLVKQWDVASSLGGPLKRDRLWFFVNARTTGNYITVPGRFANRNAGDATKWNYVSRSDRDRTERRVRWWTTWDA